MIKRSGLTPRPANRSTMSLLTGLGRFFGHEATTPFRYGTACETNAPRKTVRVCNVFPESRLGEIIWGRGKGLYLGMILTIDDGRERN